MLSGIDSGQMFLLAPDTDKLKRYNMLGREDYIWSDADTLYNNTSACIFKSKIQESGYIQQQRLRTVQTKALLGGVVNNKLVYSIGNRIYYDNELVYTAGDEVKKLFVGDSKIATMFGDQVSIVNFQGATECKMPVQKGTQLLAFAPKTRFLYLLNDYHSIEKINLNVKNDCSIIFNTRQFSGKLKGGN